VGHAAGLGSKPLLDVPDDGCVMFHGTFPHSPRQQPQL
jgi:hypothetical protein